MKRKQLTPREWNARYRAILKGREGCDCANTIKGKLVPANERCSKTWIRCNGVLRARAKALKALGPKPTTPLGSEVGS